MLFVSFCQVFVTEGGILASRGGAGGLMTLGHSPGA